jgi:hypothetical protein
MTVLTPLYALRYFILGVNSDISTRTNLRVTLEILVPLLCAGLIAGCAAPDSAPGVLDVIATTAAPPGHAGSSVMSEAEVSPTADIQPSPTREPTSSVKPVATAIPTEVDWRMLPVIPTLSARALEIYNQGIEAGRDPHAFSKIGDCQNVPSMFLSIFDYEGYYTLGPDYEYLQPTIDWYAGSFFRESEAVRRGFNAASVVSPLWADPESCEPGEDPLHCEIRQHNPSIAIVSLETWWAGRPENYEKYVRQILESLIQQDVLPILATKADNLEGDHSINRILVRLAQEYEIPLWNFWAAVQPLPDHGLMEDGFHLTFDVNHFNDPDVMASAWPWRNLTALQVLDTVRQEVLQP